MSRLIVKNLPSYVTPIRLREHFEGKSGPGGTLTDFKVALKPDGTSRRFGFIGYKTDAEALAAKDYFDQTFIDSTRISVNIIDGAKDAPTPRPNKRARLGPSPNDTNTVNAPSSSTTPASPNKPGDAQMAEYLGVMQVRNKGPSWANEGPVDVPINAKSKKAPAPTTADIELSQHEEPKEGLSDLEWMRRHMSKGIEQEGKSFEQSDEEVDEEVVKAPAVIVEPEVPKDPIRDTILQTSRLFVRNLAFSCTDADLLDLFKPFGEINQVHIPLDPATKQSKGLAFVSFARPTDAVAAFESLDRKSFQGRLLHVLAAVDRKGTFQVEEGEGKKSVKAEKQAKRKAVAGKDFNWGMLYMNSDAVASSIADRMNIAKSEILNPESGDNAAVKLALAETHIIQETKTYLESQGVLLSAFGTRTKSTTTILVKNIPYGTTEQQIRELFEPHGELGRVLVPPAGTMAVVDFEKPEDASNAFRAVAYRRLGNSIIYLEKGPLGIFAEGSAVPTKPSATSSSSSIPTHAIKIAEQQMGDDAQEEIEEPSITGGSTLFVKNLAFSTTQERLTEVFRHLPSFSFARVQTKPDPKRPDGPRLSMGYGFVGFKDVEGARKAIKGMQGYVLDGHALHVKFAGRGVEETETKGKSKSDVSSTSRTTKMIVKNLPFEATKKDIRELFGAHGHLKSVRLPKKFDSRTRGFAFLDFVSRHEAENVFAMLRHTHLLGRHLVLEWAEEEEQDLDVLRKKAGVGYGDGKDVPGRKRKLDLGQGEDVDVESLEV